MASDRHLMLCSSACCAGGQGRRGGGGYDEGRRRRRSHSCRWWPCGPHPGRAEQPARDHQAVQLQPLLPGSAVPPAVPGSTWQVQALLGGGRRTCVLTAAPSGGGGPLKLDPGPSSPALLVLLTSACPQPLTCSQIPHGPACPHLLSTPAVLLCLASGAAVQQRACCRTETRTG